MKLSFMKATMISILLIFAFATSSFAGLVTIDPEGKAVQVVTDQAGGSYDGPNMPFGLNIDRTVTPWLISLYDSTQHIYVDYKNSIIPDATIYFSSSDEEILKVAEDGRLIPLKEGWALITAAVLDPERGWLYDRMSIAVIDLQVKADDSTVDVLSGETALLSVQAILAPGRFPQYVWYSIDPETNEDIWIATTAEPYLIIENVTEPATVYCEVLDGTAMGGLKVYFYIRLVNLSMAYPAGDTDQYGSIVADEDGNATLVVNVIARNPENLSYSWEALFGQQLEEAGNSNVLEVSGITSFTEYQCLITDEYGNWQNLYFTVQPPETATGSDGSEMVDSDDSEFIDIEEYPFPAN